MKNIIYGVFLLCIVGCSTKKVLMKGNVIYTFNTKVTEEGSTENVYTPHSVDTKVKDVEIVDNGSYLIIKVDPVAAEQNANSPYSECTAGSVNDANLTTWKRESIGKAYFAESSDPNGKQSLWYRDDKFVFQTASILLKIRSRISNQTYLDSFPSQVETGVNVGFLVGGKRTWNRYRTSANILGHKTDKYSLTGGAILSVGAADLSATTTRPKIVFPKKMPMVSYGAAIVVGINSINLGYAIGFDQPIGQKASTWIYEGRLWNGIIISIDLIK